MTGYLFLGRGGVGLFDGRRWPLPDGAPAAWVTGRVDGADAVRAYRPAELAYWIDDDLWVVEIDGQTQVGQRMIRAGRGRLVSRVEGWDAGAAVALADASADRAREVAVSVLRREGHDAQAAALAAVNEPADLERAARAVAGEVPRPASDIAAYLADTLLYARESPTPGAAAAVASYISARAAGCARPDDYARTFAGERAWQSAWICERAGIEPAAA